MPSLCSENAERTPTRPTSREANFDDPLPDGPSSSKRTSYESHASRKEMTELRSLYSESNQTSHHVHETDDNEPSYHALPFEEASSLGYSASLRTEEENMRRDDHRSKSKRPNNDSASEGSSRGDAGSEGSARVPPVVAKPNRPKDRKKNGEKKEESKKKRVFGITRDRPFNGPLPDDYEHRYPEDEFGEEMGPTARVWRVYLDETEFNDRDMVEGWKDGIDVLLVFAGLFSAVVTTFVTQTSQKLDVDYGEVSASLLTELITLQRAAYAGTPFDQVNPAPLNLDSPAHFDTIDVWVNALWFTSLSFSLVTALGAVVIKQWIQHYVSLPSGTPNERVRLHQFRYMGIQRWSVPAIIGVLPFLMHISLFLFFGGLVAYLSSLKPEIAWAIGIIAGATCILYVITNVLPLGYPQCPYRTPLVVHAHTLASLTAFAVHRSAVLILYRLLPQLSLHALGSQAKETRFVTWCKERLKVELPQYSLTSLRDVEIQAAAKVGLSLDTDAIRWLYNFSSNPSVRNIALQAFSGIRHAEQSDALIDTFMETELKDAVQSKLLIAVSHYYKDPDPLVKEFAQSRLFLELERLLRASMLVFDSPIFSSTHCVRVVTALLRRQAQQVDRKRLLAYAAYAFANCDDYGLDASLSDSELTKLAGDLFEMSEINQHPAGKYPLIWKGFFAILDRFTPIFYGNTSIQGFLNANTNLLPLLDMMLLSELSYPGQVTDNHKEVVQSIVDFLYRTIGNGLPRKMSIMFPVPAHDRGKYDLRVKSGCSSHLQFWAVLMRAILSSCTDGAFSCRFALLNHLARLSDYCHRYPPPFVAIPDANLTSILSALDDLYHQPFFYDTKWDYPTYEEFFFLYLKIEVHHNTGTLLINPLLRLISENIMDQNLVKGVFGCLGQIMKDYSVNRSSSTKGDRGTEAIKKVVSGVVDCLHKMHEEDNLDALATLFSVLSELNWLEELLTNIGAMIDRYPPIWYWRTVQPLVHVLLEIMLAYLNTEMILPTQMSEDIDMFYEKMKAETTLEVLCEMFICLTIPDPYPLGDADMPMPEAKILLELAKRDVNSESLSKPWRRYIRNLVNTFSRLHSANQFDRAKKPWKEWDYDQYERVAKFVDELKENLGIPLGDYEIARFDEGFISRQLQLERARTFDVLGTGESTVEDVITERQWSLGGIGRFLRKTKKRPDSHAISSEDEKGGVGNLV